MKSKAAVIFFLSLVLVFSFACKQTTYDLAILNGIIVTGDGNPRYTADIGIKDGRILFTGKVRADSAAEVIDASGHIICPGFIDIHTHADRKIDDIPTADNYLLQGATTVVGGNCGGHPFPLAEFFEKIEQQGTAINFCSLAGHNTIRREVMNRKMTVPTPGEMEQMKHLLDLEMAAGGIGLSTGLAYMPGTYSDTQELVELASVIKKYDGLYATHLRDQGEDITQAIEEAIRVGSENNIRVQISHIKLSDDKVWGKVEMITDPIEAARAKGVEVTLDQYPYTATSSGFSSSFPSWCLEGDHEDFLKRLEDPENYKKIKAHLIRRRLTSSKDIDKLKTIYIARYEENPEYEGKNLEEILALNGKKATKDNGADMIIDIEKKGGASCVFFQMDEADVKAIMTLDYNMIGSDGAIISYGEGVPHCRSYGTFPRVIHHYVFDQKTLSLEEAIRKMTSLPAQTLRLNDRGLIKEGFYADLVVFDPEKIKDTATYSDPHQYPEGINYVIVNGKIAAREGKPTGILAGKVLYGPGKK